MSKANSQPKNKNQKNQRKLNQQLVKTDQLVKNLEKKIQKKPNKRKKGKNKGNGPKFTKATWNLMSAIVNPIHYCGPCKVTDLNCFDTMLMNDSINLSFNFTLESDLVAESASGCDGVVLYATYGPGYTVDSASIYYPNSAYTLFIIPISSGRPIYGSNQNIAVYAYTGINYSQVWNLSNTIRMCTAGYRVLPIIELNTNNAAGAIDDYYVTELSYGTFLDWASSSSDTTITDLIFQHNMQYGRYTNKDGCSARHDPFQQSGSTYRYFDQNFFNAPDLNTLLANMSTFGTLQMNYPLMYVVFQQEISYTPSSMIANKRTLYGIKQTRKYKLPDNKLNNVISEREQKIEEMLDENFNIKPDYRPEVTWTYTGWYLIPFSVEYKIFIESDLIYPTPLTALPSPVDPNWDKVNVYMTMNKSPKWSDGHSFGTAFKWLKKHVTPNNIRKFGKGVRDYAGAIKESYGDMTAMV